MEVSHFENSGVGHWYNGQIPHVISGISNDTRTICPGDCFVALVTDKQDGHKFLYDAKKNGASCAIVSRPDDSVTMPQFVCNDTQQALIKLAKYIRRQYTGAVLAVTGSVGKTTTKELLKLLFGIKNNATKGSQNGQLGVPLTLCMLNNQERFAVIEIGIDEPGTMCPLLDMVRPDAGIVTSIAKVHVTSLGDEEKIAHEKSCLVKYCHDHNGVSFFPENLLSFDAFKQFEQYDDCNVVRENMSYVETLYGSKYDGHIAHVSHNGESHIFNLPREMSCGIAKNFILCATVALHCGVLYDAICDRLSDWRPANMRGNIVVRNGRHYFVDCYNANPMALTDSLLHFNRLFPHDQCERLFVIGALDESVVGHDFLEENKKILSMSVFHDDDNIVLIGKRSHEIAKVAGRKNIICRVSTDDARNDILSFNGYVYLKGHRFYRLEDLIV